ncbi:uncharacterized protein [Arachis hypogaea]|uniref:uncharacterized protein n=1 Tax=Arachis hypogaea TaxID=3818 RepID=UPI003B214985
MGYYFYHPSDHKVFVARGGTFLEKEFLSEGRQGEEIELDEVQETNEIVQAQEYEIQVEQPTLDVLKLTPNLSSSRVEDNEPIVVQREINEPILELPLEPVQQSPNLVQELPLRRSTREHRPSLRLNLMVQDDVENGINYDDNDPKTYEEAMQSSESLKWQSAIESEIESMRINNVWTLVEPSKDIKPIGCKWVYKKKIGADGKVETYKARLVAKGYR